MREILDLYTPEEAWESLRRRVRKYYRSNAAVYSGIHSELRVTGECDSFWRRRGKARIHVPIAADIASTSADLLFSEMPRFTCFDETKEDEETDKQVRLMQIVDGNDMSSKLHEAAESAAALGDVFFKVSFDKDKQDIPIISVCQADEALPEYRNGVLKCIHFFTVIKIDQKDMTYWRVYEQFTAGKIVMAVYKGNTSQLGERQPDSEVEDLGFSPEITTPVPDMILAAHIPNMRPNRVFRTNDIGRSDFDGLRDMMDSLDEAWSSWMRDIRLAKSRLIVPAEYLRRKPADMFKDGEYKFDFDEDVETLTAIDLDTEKAGTQAITPSQFLIRSKEHAETVESLIRNIVSMAGYSMQTFGMDIDGNAQSGTALRIREKKSFNTRGKKENYWKSPLERLMTAVIQLDAKLYKTPNVHPEDRVRISFADPMANDLATLASTLEALHRAQAVSTEIAVRMQHPEWTDNQVMDEVRRINERYDIGMSAASTAAGDLENPLAGGNDDDEGGEE